MWVYILFNIAGAVFIYWLARVPKAPKKTKTAWVGYATKQKKLIILGLRLCNVIDSFLFKVIHSVFYLLSIYSILFLFIMDPSFSIFSLSLLFSCLFLVYCRHSLYLSLSSSLNTHTLSLFLICRFFGGYGAMSAAIGISHFLVDTSLFAYIYTLNKFTDNCFHVIEFH